MEPFAAAPRYKPVADARCGLRLPVTAALLGACLIYDDGTISQAISMHSAVESSAMTKSAQKR
jgi:K+ transporter